MGMYPTINSFYLNVLKCYYHLCVKRQGEKTICSYAIRLYNNNLLIHVEVASKLGDVEILNWFENVLGYFSHYLLRCTQSIWKWWLLLQHRFYCRMNCLFMVRTYLRTSFHKIFDNISIVWRLATLNKLKCGLFLWTMMNSKFLYSIITTQKCLM